MYLATMILAGAIAFAIGVALYALTLMGSHR